MVKAKIIPKGIAASISSNICKVIALQSKEIKG
jgi:hypothetical protein